MLENCFLLNHEVGLNLLKSYFYQKLYFVIFTKHLNMISIAAIWRCPISSLRSWVWIMTVFRQMHSRSPELPHWKIIRFWKGYRIIRISQSIRDRRKRISPLETRQNFLIAPVLISAIASNTYTWEVCLWDYLILWLYFSLYWTETYHDSR